MDRNTARELYRSGEEPTIAKLMELDDENERLKKKIASLSQNSTNSSKPPSSDGPSVKRPVNEPSKRKPGGQPGHKGHKRALLPAEEMTHLIDLHPERCRRCGRLLADTQEIGKAVRNQTFDIPPIKLVKTEYRRHAYRCECGCVTRASLPDIATESQFGPAIHALAAYLVTSHRVSRRGAAEIMSSVLNLDISLGAVDEMVMRVGDAMKPVVDDLVNRMPQQDHFNIDETGWKNKKDKRWIWAFVSVVFSVFKLSASRGSIVLESMLGKDFNGKITSDDFSAYNKYVNKKKWQLCWAHLLRKFIALLDGGPEAERFGQAMLTASWQLFSYWHLYKQRAFDTELWITRADEIRREIMELCVVYSEASDEMVRKRAQKTLEKIEMLFTFVRAKGVEPTNNAAERALRPVVQLRKMCFGSCSEAGEHFIERAFSIKETCRKHNKNILTYLSNLMKSAFEKRPFPALI